MQKDDLPYEPSVYIRPPNLIQWLLEFVLLADVLIFILSLSIIETNLSAALGQWIQHKLGPDNE